MASLDLDISLNLLPKPRTLPTSPSLSGFVST